MGQGRQPAVGNKGPKENTQQENRLRNLGKSGLTPDEIHCIPLVSCPGCGDLRGRQGKANSGRLVEDIRPPAEKTTIFKEVTESKWCDHCKTMVSSTSETALPGSDIGLNAMIEMADLWVMCALSFPKIRDLFINFKTLRLSTAGISRLMIRLSDILQPVYEEILQTSSRERRSGPTRPARRVKGKLWWLWIFANERSAYYWPDRTRGGAGR